MFWECVELLSEGRLPVKLKGAAYKSYVMPAILCMLIIHCVSHKQASELLGVVINYM